MGVYYGKADFITYGKPSLFLDFANKKSLVDRMSGNNLITFSRNSIGTYVGSDGLIKTASANDARFDHNSLTGESLGLLVEESRSNLWLNSETNILFGTGFTNNFTLPGGLTNPAGGTTATKILTGSSQTWWSQGSGAYSFTSGEYYTMSWWAYSTTTAVNFGNSDYFNLSNTTISSQTVTTPGQWVKCYRTVQFTATGSAQVRFMTYNSTLYTDENNPVYIWGAQLEEGAFPTSYIPTTSAEVTRSADSASITGSNFSNWYNNDAGTFHSKGDLTYSSGSNVFRTLILSGSFPSRRWSWNMIETINTFQSATDGMDHGNFYSNMTPNIPNNFNIAQAIKNTSTTNVSSAAGGVIVGSTSGFAAYNPNFLSIGTNSFTGRISRLVYYPTRLTDAQLQSITR